MATGSDAPSLTAYLHLEFAPLDKTDDRRPFGISATVEEPGGEVRTFQGYGFADDQEFPRAAAVHQLLEALPDAPRLVIHMAGLSTRLDHFKRGNGKKSDGSRFIGSRHLEVLLAAREADRLEILKPPQSFTRGYQLAKHGAKKALEEVRKSSTARGNVEAVFNANTLIHFRETSK